jgi:hypothetical protein
MGQRYQTFRSIWAEKSCLGPETEEGCPNWQIVRPHISKEAVKKLERLVNLLSNLGIRPSLSRIGPKNCQNFQKFVFAGRIISSCYVFIIKLFLLSKTKGNFSFEVQSRLLISTAEFSNGPVGEKSADSMVKSTNSSSCRSM